MSNPPVPPSSPDGSEQDAPRYGQQSPSAPQYGQQAPQPPQYGQQQPPAAPQYGQVSPPVPQYGQQQPPAAPQYGQVNPPVPQYGQQPPQSGTPGYGQFPYSPYASEQPQGPKGVPKLVNIAFWLIIGSGVAWLLSVLLSIGLVDTPELREEFERQMAASGADIRYESIKGMLIGTIVAVGLIGAGLYALIALNIRKGKNWARILGTVFAALSLLGLFPLGLGTLSALAGIAGIVLLYLPESAPYFQKRQPFANPYGQPGAPFGR